MFSISPSIVLIVTRLITGTLIFSATSWPSHSEEVTAPLSFRVRPADFGTLPEELVVAIADLASPVAVKVPEQLPLRELVLRKCGDLSPSYLQRLQKLNRHLFPNSNRLQINYEVKIPKEAELILPACVLVAPMLENTDYMLVKFRLSTEDSPWQLVRRSLGSGENLPIENLMKHCKLSTEHGEENCGDRLRNNLQPGTVISFPPVLPWTNLTINSDYGGITTKNEIEHQLANMLAAQGFKVENTAAADYIADRIYYYITIDVPLKVDVVFTGTQSFQKSVEGSSELSCVVDGTQNFNTVVWTPQNLSALQKIRSQVASRLLQKSNENIAPVYIAILDNGVFWPDGQKELSLPSEFRSKIVLNEATSESVPLYALQGTAWDLSAPRVKLLNDQVIPETPRIKALRDAGIESQDYDLDRWPWHGTYVGAEIWLPLQQVLLTAPKADSNKDFIRSIQFRAADLTDVGCEDCKIDSLAALVDNSKKELMDALDAMQSDPKVKRGFLLTNVSFLVDSNGDEARETEYEGRIRLVWQREYSGLVIAAAGNAASPVSSHYFPQSQGRDRNASVITVGASDYDNRLADFSNHGKAVSLLAPGCEVPVDHKVGTASYAPLLSEQRLVGTSFAAPLVTATAAMIASLPLQWDKGEWGRKIKDRLLQSTDPTIPNPSLDREVGVLNPIKALASVAFDVVDFRLPNTPVDVSTRRISWGDIGSAIGGELDLCSDAVRLKDVSRFIRIGSEDESLAYLQRKDEDDLAVCGPPADTATIDFTEYGYVDFNQETGVMSVTQHPSPKTEKITIKSISGLVINGTPELRQ